MCGPWNCRQLGSIVAADKTDCVVESRNRMPLLAANGSSQEGDSDTAEHFYVPEPRFRGGGGWQQLTAYEVSQES
jgi:hypothetical protein